MGVTLLIVATFSAQSVDLVRHYRVGCYRTVIEMDMQWWPDGHRYEQWISIDSQITAVEEGRATVVDTFAPARVMIDGTLLPFWPEWSGGLSLGERRYTMDHRGELVGETQIDGWSTEARRQLGRTLGLEPFFSSSGTVEVGSTWGGKLARMPTHKGRFVSIDIQPTYKLMSVDGARAHVTATFSAEIPLNDEPESTIRESHVALQGDHYLDLGDGIAGSYRGWMRNVMFATNGDVLDQLLEFSLERTQIDCDKRFRRRKLVKIETDTNLPAATLQFESRSVRLVPNSAGHIAAIAEALAAYPNERIEIRGCGADENLASRRATTVMRELRERGGDPERMQVRNCVVTERERESLESLGKTWQSGWVAIYQVGQP